MNTSTLQKKASHPVLQVIKSFIGKLRQNPDIYPIKYYKKNRRFRRHWQGPIVK